MSSRSRAGGLPSGPGPRSRSVARTRDDDRDRYDNDSDGGRAPSRSSGRQVRPQKSLASLSQGRSDSQPPPMPSSRSRRNPEPSYDSRPDSRSGTNRSSDSTTSSGSSSFLDRIKQGAGYASSRTSLEDDESDKRPAQSTKSRPTRRDSSPPPDNDTSGDGYTLWSKVASAASSLTVNVGKAWATNITTFAGEDTPPGQESRLTRAMKAYHVEKARDPSDLPPWLFDEKERRRPAPEPSRSKRRDDDYDDNYEVADKARAEPPPSRGLRDIYEAAASSSSSTPSLRSTRGARSYADDSPQPSRATDRLKALRDAKRGAIAPAAAREEERERDAPREPETPQPRRRVGLPSGPVSRRL